MKTRLQSITGRLKGDIARWTQLLAKMSEVRLPARDSYECAMRQALVRKPFLKTDGHYLSREEVHLRSFRI